MVDTEVVGKKLVQKGQLKRRYTIIPLNKIVSRKISPDIVKKANALVCKMFVYIFLVSSLIE